MDRLRTPVRRLALVLCCVLSIGASAHQPRGDVVQVWVTTADRSQLLARGGDRRFGAGASLPLDIDVDASVRYQEYLGVGAAFTDAAAQLFDKRLGKDARRALLRELLGPAPGLGLNLMRIPIGATDFSSAHYSLDDRPLGETDPALAHFALGPHGERLLSLVRAAHAINPQIRLIASPWSAPGWMKNTGSLIGGRLLPQYYDAFADYLLRFAGVYRNAGVPLYAITVQNEPGYEPIDYPGMRFDAAERARFIGAHLGPKLKQQPQAPILLDYDHNWDVPNSPLQVLADPEAARYIAGVAWHCYRGHVAAQALVGDVFPQLVSLLTECSGGGWDPGWSKGLHKIVGTLLIEGARNGGQGVILWNLALDERHGPHLGGCTNCRGVVTIDSSNGQVTRNVDYYGLAHLSRFVRPGARRIASGSGMGGLYSVAYLNADDGSLALLVYNGAHQARRFTVTSEQRHFVYALPADSVATFWWRPSAQETAARGSDQGPDQGVDLE
jgi:glucosylceramidase